MNVGDVVPLAPGSLLTSASAELKRQIAAIVPPDKRGAAITIIDKDGVRIGIAMAYKDTVTVSLEAHKGWDRHPPTASLKIQATF